MNINDQQESASNSNKTNSFDNSSENINSNGRFNSQGLPLNGDLSMEERRIKKRQRKQDKTRKLQSKVVYQANEESDLQQQIQKYKSSVSLVSGGNSS